MPTAFITGATGFIGGHIVRRLASRGYRIRALVRSTSRRDGLENFPVEWVDGDLSHTGALREAMEGCNFVFHAAADYRLWARYPAAMYATNVDGTRNVLQAALDAKVDRLVYTSTVGTIGLNGHHQPVDETSFLKLEKHTGHYKKSKFLAEQEALKFAKKGLPVIIVNPSAPVGSHDWKPTPTGRIVLDFINGRIPMYLDTGLNFVDVEDVAEGHVLAAHKGRIGERYILGHQNLKLKELLNMLAGITGIPAPDLKLPYPLALMAGWTSELLTRITGGNEPRVPLEGVHMARKYMFFKSDKAMRELGYRPGTVRAALWKAVQWFSENGYLKQPLPSSFVPIPAISSNDDAAMVEEAIAIAE